MESAVRSGEAAARETLAALAASARPLSMAGAR
jgi:hypothetical protein